MATFADALWIDGNSKISLNIEREPVHSVRAGLGAVAFTIRDDGYGSNETTDGAMQLCVRLSVEDAFDAVDGLVHELIALRDELRDVQNGVSA
jgi:hypothetical protein